MFITIKGGHSKLMSDIHHK